MSALSITILSDGSPIEGSFELLSIDIVREVNRIPYAWLVLNDGDIEAGGFPVSDTDTFKLGTKIEVKVGYEGDPDSKHSVFKGLVVGHSLAMNTQGTRLTVELKDSAISLTLNRKSVVHEAGQTDDKIIGTILGGAKGEIAATKAEQPQLVQYAATDWDFILSRADLYGYLVAVKNGKVTVLKVDLSADSKASFQYGIDEIYNVEMSADAGHQLSQVDSAGWDPKEQEIKQSDQAQGITLKQGNLDGKAIADAIGTKETHLSSAVPLDPKELAGWSEGILTKSRLSLIRGRMTLPGRSDIELTDLIELKGMGKRFNGKAMVTGIRHRADAQHGWQTDLQLGLSAERFAERAGVADTPAAGLLPAVHGLQIGIVTQADGADPDKEFRVKVHLVGIKDSAVWARVALPDASKEHGSFSRPKKGDEVIVGFFNDDPRQAVILGAMYSSKNTPPDVAKLGDEKANYGLVTEKATILVNDADGIIQIEDKQGNAIVLDKDGITIKSGKDLKIETKGDVAIKSGGKLNAEASGDVTIKGSKVDVQ